MAPLSVARLLALGAARLGHLPNAELDAEMLLRGVTGLSRADLLTRSYESITEVQTAAYDAAVSRRERHEPIQYILGRAAFWRDEFVVSPAVLIPRPDTEILIEAVATRMKSAGTPRLLDVGTGSGCIALSLLRELPTARALAVDVSVKALAVARENARQLGLDSRIEFRISNWFDGLDGFETFDAVVSNPPYVARSDESMLAPEVRDFEPSLALFAAQGDDLSSYRSILAGVFRHLRPGGLLAFEAGIGQAALVGDELSAAGISSIEVLKDLAGIDRVVIGRRNQ